MTLQQVMQRARQLGLHLTCAESCTGGLLAATLTELPGSSAVFDMGFVTYSNAAKTQLLGVRPETLADHGAVSPEVAAQMAEGARVRAKADLAVAITGIAGPGGSDHKPAGMVCFGLASPKGLHSETRLFGALGRANVRMASRDYALELLLSAMDTLPEQ